MAAALGVHFYYSLCPEHGPGKLTILALTFYVAAGLSFLSFLVFRCSRAVFEPKRTLDDADNILQTVLFHIENKHFNRIVPENEICFDCLVKQQKHMGHCEECDACAHELMTHSLFLG